VKQKQEDRSNMQPIERRKLLAREMHELADFLADTDDPQINHLDNSHWDLMATVLRAFCPKPAEPEKILQDGRVSLALVLSEVSLQMHMPAPVILADRKTQRVIFVRQLAMYISRRVAGLSYPVIGAFFKRDHSTVIHAENLIAVRIDSEPAFAHTVDKLCAAIRTRADRMADASRKAA
jgi:chromosomal replication initiation ATPase DnaA